MSELAKLYVLSYNEVQIAGYRIFISYNEALKEFIKHCILETKDLLTEDDDEEIKADPVTEEIVEEIGSESEEKSDDEESEYDAMSCVFEIQELNGNEFVTVKEYDYEVFQEFIEDKEDILSYLDELEKKIDSDEIPEELTKLFIV